MNTELALIKLLLNKPHDIISLNRDKFQASWIKNPTFRKVYKKILDCQIKFQTVPTSDELAEVGFEDVNEPVEYSIEQCVEGIITAHNKEHGKNLAKKFSETLINKTPEEAKEFLAQSLNGFVNIGRINRSKNITELTEEILTNYKRIEEHRGEITGIATGFKKLDEMTMGFQPTWLVTIMGRNASYKTWIMIQWALHAWRLGHNVAFFSCEMGETEVANRIHALAADVQPTKIRQGSMDVDEKARYIKHLTDCEKPPFGKLFINDNPSNMSDIAAEIENYQQTYPLDVIFIDSAYRMKSDGDTEVVRQGNIARGAKDLAKKYNIPVICSIQANREFAKANSTEKTKDKTASGGFYGYGTDAWNQDSDMIFLINRPENFAPFNYSEFVMDKFRHGSIEDLILEINLNIPKIVQVDTTMARDKISGAPTKATQEGEVILFDAQNSLKEFMDHFSKKDNK
jgi:replicative DNA helicase